MVRISTLRLLSTVLVAAGVLTPGGASAHWCNSLWISRYNLVVRPASDTVTLPGTLDVYVQNNMGYALKAFDLSATASGATVTNIQKPALTQVGSFGYLLPGQKLKYTLTLGGSGAFDVQNISFFVENFGNDQNWGNGASSRYGDLDQSRTPGSPPASGGGSGFVIKKSTGGVPSGGGTFNLPTSYDGPGSQAMYLRAAAAADWRTAGAVDSTAVDNMLRIFCTDTLFSTSPRRYCSPTNCTEEYGSYLTVGYAEELWAIGELAVRKTGLNGDQIADAVIGANCGATKDQPMEPRLFDMLALGYLGRSQGAWTSPVQSDVRAKLAAAALAGSANVNVAMGAKAAHYITGDATYETDVDGCLASGSYSTETKILCAAARAIVLGAGGTTDAEMSTYVVNKVYWTSESPGFKAINVPTAGNIEGPLNITGFYASHVLGLVAWDRRGYAPSAGDSGCVSFYDATCVSDTVKPRAPVAACGVAPSSTPEAPVVRVSWPRVDRDINDDLETVFTYTVHYGTTPGTYAHTTDVTDPTGARPYNFADLDQAALTPAQPYFFAVTAVDGNSVPPGLASDMSAEVSCTLPVAKHFPTAVLSCGTPAPCATPGSCTPPQTITCTCTASTDAGDDLAGGSCAFILDGNTDAANEVPFGTGSWEFIFDQAAAHSITLVVTDAAGDASNNVAEVVVYIGNPPVIASITATPNPTPPNVDVAFTAAVSNTTSPTYDWSFGDGTAHSTTTNPTHQYSTAGSKTVVLTLTDGASGLPATRTATVVVVQNHAPDLTMAFANPVVVAPGGTVTFNADGISDPDVGQTLTVDWDFGDGTPHGSTRSVNHTYGAAIASYTAVLTVTDDGVPAMTATKELTIDVTTNRAPNIDAARVAPVSGAVPLPVSMTCDTCADPDGQAVTYTWTVSLDNQSSETVTGQNGVYTFTRAGTHHITLVARDSDPLTPLQTTKAFTVTVREGAAPGADAVPPAIVAGCACRSTSAADALGLAAAATLALARRRRRRS
ncbi:MAG: PKD domain-containing protein [Deltaproteobacteria bacterium]|nr:PKD domain-containing protein [Deltaproteobacteria bacterium]